jgi:hypothetical protein
MGNIGLDVRRLQSSSNPAFRRPVLRVGLTIIVLVASLFATPHPDAAEAATFIVMPTTIKVGEPLTMNISTPGETPQDGSPPPAGSERPQAIRINPNRAPTATPGNCTGIRGFPDFGPGFSLGLSWGLDTQVQFPGGNFSIPQGVFSCSDSAGFLSPGDYIISLDYQRHEGNLNVTSHTIDVPVRVLHMTVQATPAEIIAGGSVSIALQNIILNPNGGERVTSLRVQCPSGAVSDAVGLALDSLNNGSLSAITFPGLSFTGGACQTTEGGRYTVRVSTRFQQAIGFFDVRLDSDGDGVTDNIDNCPEDPNPDQEDADQDGEGDACEVDDSDSDGVRNPEDNCPNDPNPEQIDEDHDGLGVPCDTNDADFDNDGVEDDEDNCRFVPNPDQNPEACAPPDTDGDGVPDRVNGVPVDNCPAVPNPGQEDTDLVPDGFGDACDPPDGDGDGTPNIDDNCPNIENPDQRDTNGNGVGDECDFDSDSDGDSVPDAQDNCPSIRNPDQTDSDNDTIGDVCEAVDSDGDGHLNLEDNCPFNFNPGQFDADSDGIGDLCDFDSDSDGDGFPDPLDNCPFEENADQLDSDQNGTGDACDPFFDRDGDGLSDEQEEELGTDPNTPTNIFDGINTFMDGEPTNVSNPVTSGDTVGVAINVAANVDSVLATVTNPEGVTAYQETLIPQSPVVFSFVANANGIWRIVAGLYDGMALLDTLTLNLLVGGDTDGDGKLDIEDNCPAIANADQADTDGDAIGDACDASPHDAPTACAGMTFDSVLVGTSGNDNLNGGNGRDLIFALGGNDRVEGGNGDDCIVGGPGDDTLLGNNGNDRILGGTGNDSLHGGNGNDQLEGGEGNDTLKGDNGNDQAMAGSGDDSLEGGNGNDTLAGGDGNDTAAGANGNDACTAEAKSSCES